MSADTIDSAAAQKPLGLVKTIIIGIAGLFYAYGVWNAVAYLVTMAQLGLNMYGWFVLIFSVLFPILVFVIAFAIGRRRRAGDLAVALIAGLGLVAVFWVNVVAFSALSFSTLSV